MISRSGPYLLKTYGTVDVITEARAAFIEKRRQAKEEPRNLGQKLHGNGSVLEKRIAQLTVENNFV